MSMRISVQNPKRGGARRTRKLTKGTQRLFEMLWENHGGISAAARLLGMPPQKLLNWRLQGKVPLNSLGLVAEKLNVNRYALNFKGMQGLAGKNGSWKEVVHETFKNKQQREYVLKGEPPE